MIAVSGYNNPNDDTTCTSTGNGGYDSVTITCGYGKVEEPEFEFDEWAESFKAEIRAWHNNSTRIKTKLGNKLNARKNNRQMNCNSGSFWHVQKS